MIINPEQLVATSKKCFTKCVTLIRVKQVIKVLNTFFIYNEQHSLALYLSFNVAVYKCINIRFKGKPHSINNWYHLRQVYSPNLTRASWQLALYFFYLKVDLKTVFCQSHASAYRTKTSLFWTNSEVSSGYPSLGTNCLCRTWVPLMAYKRVLHFFRTCSNY